MSNIDSFVDSLNDEQRQQLLNALQPQALPSGVTNEPKLQPKPKGKVKVNDDFTVDRDDEFRSSNKTPVKAGKNQFVDTGRIKLDDDVAVFDEYEDGRSRAQRQRRAPSKKEVECSVCGKRFKINSSLVYGKYHRCNSCVGR